MKMKRILAIDPSINFCGVAVFKFGKLDEHALLTPLIKSDDWVEKAKDIYRQINIIHAKYDIDERVVETPTYWGAAGYLARESGAIMKLMFLCGMLVSWNNSIVIFPNTWKGQLPKEVVRNRLMKRVSGGLSQTSPSGT